MRNFLSYIAVAIFLFFSLASSARSFEEVVSAMISVVPEGNDDFKQGLKDILSSYKTGTSSESYQFAAPEELKDFDNNFWDKVTLFLNQNLPKQDKFHRWQQELVDIYTDKLDYKKYVPKSSQQGQKAKAGCCVLF